MGVVLVPIIFAIRYSVLSRSLGMNIAKDVDYEEYRSRLFDPARLALKQELFAEIALPTLAAQQGTAEGRTAVYLYASTEMPEAFKRSLEAILEPHASWAEVIYVPPDGQLPHADCIRKRITWLGLSKTLYVHARMDDDDALSDDFCARLRDYVSPQTVGFGISLGAGYAGYYDTVDKRFAGMFTRRSPMTAIGLGIIGDYDDGAQLRNAYGLGHHTKIDERVPVILDSRSPAFIRTVYAEQDSKGETGYAGQPVPPEEISADFSLRPALFPSIEESARQKAAAIAARAPKTPAAPRTQKSPRPSRTWGSPISRLVARFRKAPTT